MTIRACRQKVFVVRTRDFGGRGSVWIVELLMSLGFVVGCTIIIEAYVLRRLRFDWLTVAIVLAGSIVSVDYLTYTSVSERNYDGSSHIEYIQAIAPGHLPSVRGCGVCGHPPGYYALARAVCRAG